MPLRPISKDKEQEEKVSQMDFEHRNRANKKK